MNHTDETDQLFDAISVSLKDSRVKWVIEGKTKEDAEAIVGMAVYRQGNIGHIFLVKPAGEYKVGDTYQRKEETND